MGAYCGLVTDISGRISCSCATDWSPVDGVMLSQIHRHATDAQPELLTPEVRISSDTVD